MTTLTRAELAHYPGRNSTEQALCHHLEGTRRAGSRALAAKPLARSKAHGALALPRFLDLRPFPGRDRTERVMGWLLAHVPRAHAWSQETLRELAGQIALESDCVE